MTRKSLPFPGKRVNPEAWQAFVRAVANTPTPDIGERWRWFLAGWIQRQNFETTRRRV